MTTIKAQLIETAVAALQPTMHEALAERVVNAVLDKIIELTPSPRAVDELTRIRSEADA